MIIEMDGDEVILTHSSSKKRLRDSETRYRNIREEKDNDEEIDIESRDFVSVASPSSPSYRYPSPSTSPSPSISLSSLPTPPPPPSSSTIQKYNVGTTINNSAQLPADLPTPHTAMTPHTLPPLLCSFIPTVRHFQAEVQSTFQCIGCGFVREPKRVSTDYLMCKNYFSLFSYFLLFHSIIFFF